MENLIPRWYRELELFRGVKPLLVLEGCVMDQVRVPVTGSVAEDTLLPLSAFLNAYLSDAGYEQVVFYSNLVGLMNPYAPEMLDNFAKTNQAEVVSGAIPAEFKGNEANTAPNIIRRAMMQGKHATAVAISSRLTASTKWRSTALISCCKRRCPPRPSARRRESCRIC